MGRTGLHHRCTKYLYFGRDVLLFGRLQEEWGRSSKPNFTLYDSCKN